MQLQGPMHVNGNLWKNNVETLAFVTNPDQPHQKIAVAKRPAFRDESLFQMSLFCDFFLSRDHWPKASLQIRMARSKSIPSDQSLASTTRNSRCLACLSKRKSWLRLSTSRCNLTWFGTWVVANGHSGITHPELHDYIYMQHLFLCGFFIQGAGATLKAGGRHPNVAGPTTGPGAKHLEAKILSCLDLKSLMQTNSPSHAPMGNNGRRSKVLSAKRSSSSAASCKLYGSSPVKKKSVKHIGVKERKWHRSASNLISNEWWSFSKWLHDSFEQSRPSVSESWHTSRASRDQLICLLLETHDQGSNLSERNASADIKTWHRRSMKWQQIGSYHDWFIIFFSDWLTNPNPAPRNSWAPTVMHQQQGSVVYRALVCCTTGHRSCTVSSLTGLRWIRIQKGKLITESILVISLHMTLFKKSLQKELNKGWDVTAGAARSRWQPWLRRMQSSSLTGIWYLSQNALSTFSLSTPPAYLKLTHFQKQSPFANNFYKSVGIESGSKPCCE